MDFKPLAEICMHSKTPPGETRERTSENEADRIQHAHTETKKKHLANQNPGIFE